MASLRKRKGKYANIKCHVGRARREDGTSFDVPTDYPIEPPNLSTEDPGYAEAKRDLEELALEHVNDVEKMTRKDTSTGKPKMTQEEFEARAKHRAKKVLGLAIKATPFAFIIYWLWEHVLRNRLDHTKVQALCRLIELLLNQIRADKCKTIHDVRGSHFEKAVLDMRMRSFSPGVVNNVVDYLACTDFPV